VRQQADQLLIIASDGLWDVLSSSEAGTLALGHFHSELSVKRDVSKALKGAAELLTKIALERGSRDNITVLVADVRLGYC
jgi:protein phosphatase 2C